MICFSWTSQEKTILLIGYLRVVDNQNMLKDFTSPYGYSGPVYTPKVKKQDIVYFWAEVNNWFENNNIITSFIRFSLDKNTLGYANNLKPRLLNVKGVIREKSEQWKNFEAKVRKNVNKAKRENLIVKVVKGANITKKQLKSFYQIYTTTLDRNSATKSYYISLKDFEQYCAKEGNSCLFAFVYDSAIMIAAEMVLLSNNSLYSFLGGTVSSAFSKRPNDFLKYALINWARENNYAYFILGGGYGKEDGIFKYKKSFFPNDIVTFYTGYHIFNQKEYNRLCDLHFAKLTKEEKETLKRTDFFPAYRFG